MTKHFNELSESEQERLAIYERDNPIPDDAAATDAASTPQAVIGLLP